MPTTALDNIREDVKAHVREANRTDTVDMSDADYNRFVLAALRRYSLDRPYNKVIDITGSGTRYIDRAGLTGWTAGFSVIEHIEALAPTIADDDAPNPLERMEWRWYQDTTKTYIYLVNNEPTSPDKIRVLFTIPHTIEGLESATATTVPDYHKEAIVAYAVHRAFLALAGKFADTRDPGLRLDVANYRSKSGECMRLATEWKKEYEELLTQQLGPASVVGDIDLSLNGGYEFLTHKSVSR